MVKKVDRSMWTMRSTRRSIENFGAFILDVVNSYNDRFNLGLTEQEKKI
jgi:hypothetical protein